MTTDGRIDGRWKVYFVQFECRQTGRIFYKFGITQRRDAVERFNQNNDLRWGMFRIACKGSFWCPNKDAALSFEKVLHSEYPKNIWLEKYLGHGNWNDLHGITELVALHHGKSEDDVLVNGVILRSYRGALAFFGEMAARSNYDLDAPKPREYTRVHLQNSLTYEEVQNVDRK